jgi:dephospho-CoA kinase
LLIGLSGLYCAGKNYAASLIEQRGIPVLDVDKQGYIALNNRAAEIGRTFGREALDGEGKVNRKALGALVFGNAEKMRLLEGIVHPEANRLTDEWIAAQNGAPCVINAAVLHKSSAFERLDVLLIIRCNYPERLARACKRDRLSVTAAAKRLASQRDFYSQYLKSKADRYYMDNSQWFSLLRKPLEIRIGRFLDKLGIIKQTVRV